MQVWADVDVGVADFVRYLNTLDGVRTHSCCQGSIGEGGSDPYGAYVEAAWNSRGLKLLKDNPNIIIEYGENQWWGTLHPREGQKFLRKEYELCHRLRDYVSFSTRRMKQLQ